MQTLYNYSLVVDTFLKSLSNLSLVGLVGAIAIGSVACQKTSTAVADETPARPSAEVVSETERLYSGRADLNHVRQAIVAIRQGLATDSGNYDLVWRLAKYDYYLGSHSSDSSEQSRAFREGIENGKLAVKLREDQPDGHFWLGANYGGEAEISTLAGLSEINDIKKEMDAVIKIDEKYQEASAYMVLGQVYLESPKLLGGDTQQAIEYFEKGLKVGPDNALMRWHLADAYLKANRPADARKQIDELLSMKAAQGYEAEYNEAVQGAKQLQEKIK